MDALQYNELNSQYMKLLTFWRITSNKMPRHGAYATSDACKPENVTPIKIRHQVAADIENGRRAKRNAQ